MDILKELLIHKKNIESARNAIGYESVVVYDFSDNRFDTAAWLDIIKVIEKEKENFQPEIIFTHHGGVFYDSSKYFLIIQD